MRIPCLAGCILAVVTSAASAQMTSAAAYDSVQAIRSRADSLVAAGKPGAIPLLRSALRFLDRREVRDLAQGWPYLRSRAPNVWWDLAVDATLAGDTATALDGFEKVERSGGTSGYAGQMRTDSVARRWAGNPRYEAVIDRLRQQGRLWKDSAFVSPFRDTLPEAERVAGLSLLWAEVRYGYPDFAQNPTLDWDSRYLAYLPRVQREPDTFEYFRLLQRFVAELGDSHTNVYFPRPIQARLARPPLRTQLIEDRVIVTEVLSPSLAAQGIVAGDEIERIDDVPIREYAESQIAPYQSAASPQDRATRLYTYALLTGPLGTPVSLGIRHGDGTRGVIAVRRGGYTDVRPARAAVTDSILPGNIGYLRIATFGVDSVAAWARRSMIRLTGTDALIIDLRENDGGNTTLGPLAILARAASPTPGQRFRNYSALDRARGFEGQPYEIASDSLRPDPTLHYDKPVALLIGPRTFSAGEDFAVTFDLMRRGTIVGEPSGGNTGQPLTFNLPAGGMARVRTKHDHYGDGREFLFVGIQPQILVRPTVAGIRAGRDEVLEAAMRAVK